MGILDHLFNWTQWLRTTRVTELAIWISQTRLSVWIDTHFWAVPLLQITHILAIAAAFGSIVMMNLRILGLAGLSRTMSQTARRYLPWVWWALPVLILTGLGMILSDTVRNLVNAIFWIKMALVVAMILVSLWFQASVGRRMAGWETTHDGRVAIRFGAVGIILLWCAIMVAGRWIAYVPN